MQLRTLLICISMFCAGAVAEPATTLAFGSCLRQWKPQPVWTAVLAEAPDAFIFLGDNVYTDKGPLRYRPEPERIAHAYAQLAKDPGFAALRANVPVYGTWDDHDYGRNDGGGDYPWKEASQSLFQNFFAVPDGSQERTRPGVYSVRYLNRGDRRVQIILLDTRYFRSPLKVAPSRGRCPRRELLPNTDPAATILGPAQWQWLERTLQAPADLRLLVSSIQVIPDAHCFEKWANFPAERERLLRLIRDSRANGVVILSGDRHHGDISRLPAEIVGYPLYEITASGLNSARAGRSESNRHRVAGDSVREDHFGMLRVDWHQPEPRLHLLLKGVDGRELAHTTVPLGTLGRE